MNSWVWVYMIPKSKSCNSIYLLFVVPVIRYGYFYPKIESVSLYWVRKFTSVRPNRGVKWVFLVQVCCGCLTKILIYITSHPHFFVTDFTLTIFFEKLKHWQEANMGVVSFLTWQWIRSLGKKESFSSKYDKPGLGISKAT